MTRRRKILIALVAVLVLLVAAVVTAGAWYRPMLRTGTGYAAHNACAVHFLTDRTDDPAGDLPPNPLVPVLRTEVDDSEGVASSSVLGALFTQRAWLTDHGCVVADERPAADAAADSPDVRLAPTPSAGVRLAAATIDMPAETRAAIDAAVRRATEADGTRSVVALRHGAVVGEWYAPGFGPDTRQLSWSVTKSVTDALVGRVAHGAVEGVRLDRADTGLLPEWTDERADISLDDLMRMTSGLEWDETYDLGTPITRMLYAEPDMSGYVAGLPLAHPVGEYRQYSSGSTNLACRVLADRTGLRGGLAQRLLFEPLGMGSAVLETDAAGLPVCSSYLWATPRDLARFGEFVRTDGVIAGERLLPEGWIERSVTEVPAGGEPEPYGSGWWLNKVDDGALRFPDMPADAYWASGHDGQYVVVVPSAELVVVRTGFSPGGAFDSVGMDRLVADLAGNTR